MKICTGLFCLSLLALLTTGCKTAASPSEERPTFALQAARMRYEQRLSEGGYMPENALMIAKARRDAILAEPHILGAGIYPASWTWIGPGNIGGRIRSVIIHPTQTNTMWVGTAGGGIWKTTNGGTSWAPMNDFMASLAVGCMAIDKTNPDVLYAGTGEGFFEAVEGSSNTATMRGAGIFRSIDGGISWEQLANTASLHFINRIAIHPTNGNILWAATNSGIYQSTDGGINWLLKLSGDFLDLKMSPSDPNAMVANKSHVGVFYTSDGGTNWTQATGVGGHRAELAYAPSNASIVYAGEANDDLLRVYRSLDGGHTFALQSTSSISSYAIYNNTIWVDPTNPNTLVVGGVYLYRSTNAGVSLSQTYTSVHADMHAIVAHPNFDGTTNRTIFIGCDGGIYRVADSNANGATRINNNLGVTQFYGAAVHDGTGVVLAGAQDNGTNRYTGNPLVWNENVIGGDGAYCASDPTNSTVWYGASQYQAIRRSTNSGLSFSGVSPPGSGSSNNYNFIPFFCLDPNNSNRMLAGGEFLYRSNNIRTGAPPSWTSIKPSIRFGGRPGGSGGDEKWDPQAHFADNNPWNISTMAVAEGNSDLIWVGHNNGSLYKTVNGTLTTPTWTKMDTNAPGLPDRWISRIVIDRNNTNHVYVSFMGWESNNVWRTVDGGSTWQQITGTGVFSIPPVPVGAFAIHRTKPGWLYAGTDIGIFTSSDDGATWTTTSDGPGTVPLDELVWRNDNTLMAVTHGRGIFFATIDPNAEPFSPRSFTVVEGARESGGLTELLTSNDLRLVVRNLPSTFVQVEFEGVAPAATAATLQVTVESAALTGAGSLEIALFDFTQNAWVPVSTTPPSTVDAVVSATGPAPAASYIEPGTRKVRARTTWFAGRSVRSWTTTVDQIYWKLLP
jgi:photosystem II stability/assembly factor-like uncharacterized protein